MSSYVMQDSLLHPLLKVKEAMSFSVNLKIGKELSSDEKDRRVSLSFITIFREFNNYIFADRRDSRNSRAERNN